MIGIAPPTIAECSLWQFEAMTEGHRKAHMTEAEQAKELSIDEFEALGDWVGA